MKGIFITGTTTDIGKTFIAGCIAAACRRRGYRCGVYKPFASGGVWKNGKLLSEDALFLMRAAGIKTELYGEVNPICLEPALTPALAAELSGVVIDLDKMIRELRDSAQAYDFIVVEGAGGIAAPVWKDKLIVDFMQELNLPAVIVSQAGLGSINHTVLTHAYGIAHGISMAGYILNGAPNKGVLEKSNLSYIQTLTKMVCFGYMPHVALTDDCDLAKLGEQYLAMDKIIGQMEGDQDGDDRRKR